MKKASFSISLPSSKLTISLIFFYKNNNDDYNDMIMLITMIMLTRTNDNGYDKDNYRDP